MRPLLPLILATSAVFGLGCGSCPLRNCVGSFGREPVETPVAVQSRPKAVMEKTPTVAHKPPAPKEAVVAKAPVLVKEPEVVVLPKHEPSDDADMAHLMDSLPAVATDGENADAMAADFVVPDAPKVPEGEVTQVQSLHSEPASMVEPDLIALGGPTTLEPSTPENEIAPSPKPKNAITKGYGSSTGDLAHGESYEWVQGRLQKIHSGGGFWQVRYAPFDQIDEHGGNVLLVGSVPENCQDGDIVRVSGRVLGYDRRLNATKYHLHTISVVRKGAGLK